MDFFNSSAVKRATASRSDPNFKLRQLDFGFKQTDAEPSLGGEPVLDEVQGEFSGGGVGPDGSLNDGGLSARSPVAMMPDQADSMPFILWTGKSDLCGRRIGSSNRFCTKFNCKSVHKSPTRLVLPAYSIYVPTGLGSDKAFIEPSLGQSKVSDLVWRNLLSARGDPTSLKVILSSAGELVEANATDMMLVDMIECHQTFSQVSASLHVTPGKGLKDAVLMHQAHVADVPDIRADVIAELQEKFPHPEEDTSLEGFVKFAPSVEDRLTLFDQALGLISMTLAGLDSAVGNNLFLVQGFSGRVKTELGTDESGDNLSLWEAISSIRSRMDVEDGVTASKFFQEQANRLNLAKSVETLMHTLQSSDYVSLTDQLLPTPALPKGSRFFQGVHKCLVFIDDYRITWNDEPANTQGQVGDTAPLAELDELRERLKQTELLVDRLLADSLGGGVAITGGFRYDSEEQVHEFLREISSKVALPPHSWGFVYDVWHLLDAIGSNSSEKQKSDDDVAKAQHNRKKVDLSSQELRITGGMNRRVPLAMEPEGTPVSVDQFGQPFQSLPKYSVWNTPGTKSTCRYRKLQSKLELFQSSFPVQLMRAFHHFDHGPLHDLLRAMMDMAVRHVNSLFTWIDTQYRLEYTNANADDAWSLVTGCVAGYFKELKCHREWGLEASTLGDPLETLGRVIWVFGRSLTVSQQFLEMRFRDHPVSVAVYTDHMNKSRATRMELKVVEGKLGDLEKQFSSMGGRVKKLEK